MVWAARALVLLLAWSSSCGASSSCPTCKGPTHSWDTFPVSFHAATAASNPDGTFAAGELATIVKFPLVTLEKWQGSAASQFLWQEDAWIAAATQIKRVNPNISLVVWQDSLRIYTGWFYPPKSGQVNHTLNPDADSNCATGHFRPAEYLEKHPEILLQNSSLLPALESWSRCHVFGFAEQAARDYWTNMCLNMTKSGVIDGCGADASWQDGSTALKWSLTAAQASAWAAGHVQMMRDTTAALGDGLLVGKDGYELGNYVNAVLQEGCPANNATINLLRNLTATATRLGRRLVYQCHTEGNYAAIANSAAAFLIGAGVDQYFTTGGWKSSPADNGTFATHWLPALFEPKLGAPVSDARLNLATNQWSRTFASGTVVTFDLTTNTGKITWATTSAVA